MAWTHEPLQQNFYPAQFTAFPIKPIAVTSFIGFTYRKTFEHAGDRFLGLHIPSTLPCFISSNN
ncbi:hypothetical protein K505DRAFT_134979 [Melanomma pulvis-pyrius CBS 109.77]|uniref:Uncharacterized protein n=1 Tax=Melanomma pulvis-pyrius CBS 109.77 TaxID=1314802 RepID=A0A6A6XM69_9PLEO|nr:hypothetical protein K505DRAFT_134979 [Melanomma pulvis-pyrius CBS 109.77]